MLKKLWKCGLVGVGLTLLLLVPRLALAQDPTPEAGTDTCEGCHDGLRTYWETSPHGSAYSNPVFQEAWRDAGSDKQCLQCHTTAFDAATGDYAVEGVSCTVCHNPVPANHPDNYIPTNVSSRLCGDCHLDTYAEWEESRHGAENLACSQCHNPHTAEIRVTDTQQLCQSCHTDQAHFYAYTGHAESSVLCTDCHLKIEGTQMGEGHGQREHTFAVDLATCNGCHSADMHAGVANVPDVALETQTVCYRVDSQQQAEAAPRASTAVVPERALTPLAVVVPAAFALVFGIMLGPVVEKWGRQRSEGGQ